MKDFVNAKERLRSLGNGVSTITSWLFGMLFTFLFWGIVISCPLIFGSWLGAFISLIIVGLFIILFL